MVDAPAGFFVNGVTAMRFFTYGFFWSLLAVATFAYLVAGAVRCALYGEADDGGF